MSEGNDRNTLESGANVRNGVKRLIFVLLSILAEVAILLVMFIKFFEYAAWISLALRILAAVLVLFIYGTHKNAAIKMPWIIFIMALPIFGVLLYLLVGLNGSTRKMRHRYEEIDEKLLPLLPADEAAAEALRAQDPLGFNLSVYLRNYAKYPVYRDTEVVYYPEASDGLEAQLAALREAKRFIFMEYHAIEDKESFHRIEEVLVRKVGEGVEVRLFYDDIGSIGFISTDFVKRMEAKGIRCRVFNPFMPGLNIFLNNRDHRKITVIDGKVGFTGGYNLANEYFNLTHPFGYWKDTGIRLIGPAVRSLTITFLEMWNAVKENDLDDQTPEKYLTVSPEEAQIPGNAGTAENARQTAGAGTEAGVDRSAGFVQPYADSPMDNEYVGENVYISIAESASRYAWFITPYLIITDEMAHALGLAAKRGVDVRVITPGIPDKKLIYSVTRSYYNSLARNGVRIFEYTPGFCHCKMSVSDDRVATCGTINMDYRSFYHHFENGCVIYGNPSVGEIRDDFTAIMAESREVTEQYTTGRSSFLRLGQLLLRLVAPLM